MRAAKFKLIALSVIVICALLGAWELAKPKTEVFLIIRDLTVKLKQSSSGDTEEESRREYVYATIELTNASGRAIYYSGYGNDAALYSLLYETPKGWKEPEGGWICGTGLSQYTLPPKKSVTFHACLSDYEPCRVALDYSDGRKANQLWKYIPQWVTGKFPWIYGYASVNSDPIDAGRLLKPAHERARQILRLPKDLPGLRAEAEKGNQEAQFKLAGKFFKGDGTEKNLQEAVIWYEAAATKGHAEAAYNLATIYEHGVGVTNDTEKAIDWYRLASAHGHTQAKERLATFTKR